MIFLLLPIYIYFYKLAESAHISLPFHSIVHISCLYTIILIREEYSFSLFTSPRTTHSSHPRCHSLRASTIQTSTPMARSVSTSWGRSGPQPWLLARSCSLSVLCSVTLILMTLWCLKLPGSSKLTGRSTTS